MKSSKQNFREIFFCFRGGIKIKIRLFPCAHFDLNENINVAQNFLMFRVHTDLFCGFFSLSPGVCHDNNCGKISHLTASSDSG